ncbi:MAG TPA: TIGR03032 family protein [Verrucomicrobiae bacterium]|nr:TIGR03032 family protein [Verrucomicrobiae bacterium]
MADELSTGAALSEPPSPVVQCTATDGFREWIATRRVSLLVSTYQAGKLLAIGWNGRQISLNARNFDNAMGIDVRGDFLALATSAQIQWFANAPLLATDFTPQNPGRYDAVYLQRASHFTGPLFTHDLAFAGDGELWFVNTRFSCLATTSEEYSFIPRWQPPFISALTPEDRCHLNGLAVRDGKPQTVTALGACDQPRGWRENKATGGILMDVPSGAIIRDGLAMPHSPRWHRNRLWVLNSGTGELLCVDADAGTCEVVCFLPSYLRGLTFIDNFAIVGLCKIREKRVFGGLPIEQKVAKRLCGVTVIDIRSGQLVGSFEFTSGVEEIYDIRVLDKVRQANLVPNDYSKQPGAGITAPTFSYWLLKSEEDSSPSKESPPAR